MGGVRRLDSSLVNLIAAGEVVERPASVVKELVENSLDAGARHIGVAYEEGGTTRIVVEDDGEGMGRQDAMMALERHATSKIAIEADLDSIATLGFRGEALPSIVQVSRTELVTRPADAAAGTRIVVEGGQVLLRESVGARPGTRVTVRDLFFNTPARREYLKAPANEAARILEIVGRLALAAPGVAFDVTSAGHRVLATDGSGDLRAVVGAIWGMEVADATLPVQAERAGSTLRGLISRPDASRSNRQGEILVVNGRPVTNPRLRYAAEEAYRTLLMKGRYPYLVLLLDIPPEAVDPNVHPAKAEVRFRDEADLARVVHDACREALLPGRIPPGPIERPLHMSESRPPYDASPGLGEVQTFFETAAALGAPAAGPVGAAPTARAQIRRLFLLAEGPDSLFVIDQHAAHERIGYDRLASQEVERASQQLLTPVVVRLSPSDLTQVELWGEALGEEGFVIEPFGATGEVVVRSLPAFLARQAGPAMLRSLFEELGDAPSQPLERRRHLWRAMAACRAAVKREDLLAPPEQQALIAQLWATAEPRRCPHGRPTWLELPYASLEHRLGRT